MSNLNRRDSGDAAGGGGGVTPAELAAVEAKLDAHVNQTGANSVHSSNVGATSTGRTNTLMRRNNLGQTFVGDPTDDYMAVNKRYVDSLPGRARAIGHISSAGVLSAGGFGITGVTYSPDTPGVYTIHHGLSSPRPHVTVIRGDAYPTSPVAVHCNATSNNTTVWAVNVATNTLVNCGFVITID